MSLPSEFTVTTLFGGALLLVGGIVLVVSGRYVWRATAVLRAADLDETDDTTSDSLVRVSGAAVQDAGETLVAPFSGVECVALRYQVEERRLSFLYLLPWDVTIHEATGSVEFAVQTPTETVPIAGSVRTVVLSNEVVETTSPETEPAERILAFEQDHGDVPESTVWQRPPALLAPVFGLLSLGTRRYSEQRADRGADVTVVGRLTDGEPLAPVVISDRAPAATVYRMAKTSVGGLLIASAGLLLGAVLLFLG